MLTASNLLGSSTISASVRSVGPETERFVARIETSTGGQTLIFPARMKSVGWTIVSTPRTLARRTVMVMALGMLVTMMLTMMVFPTPLTIVRLSPILISSTLIQMVKTCVETPVTTAHSCRTWTKKTRTKMVWGMLVILTRTTMGS